MDPTKRAHPTWKPLTATLAALGALALVGCDGGGDGPTDVAPGGNNNDTIAELGDPNDGQTPPAPYDQVSWSCQDVQVDNPSNPAGVQGRLLYGAGNLYYAFQKRSAPEAACETAISGQVSQAPRYNLVVNVASVDDLAFIEEQVPLVGNTADPGFITDLWGIGGAINSNGQPVYSVAAGGPGLFTCGSSDLVVIERTAASIYQIESPVLSSADFSTFCTDDPSTPDVDEATESEKGLVECCVAESACGSGDNVGPWSAVAVSGSEVAVVYSDLHNASTEDGDTNVGLELWESAGGPAGVRPWSGLGLYADAVFAPDGSLLVAFTNYLSRDGLYILRRSDGDSFEGVNGDPRGNLFPGYVIGERIALAVAPDGTVGIAFYAVENPDGSVAEDLWYCESADNGATFNTALGCTIVEDPFLRVGGFPSLAYDSQSRPALSYNYCGPDRACSRDGLRYAWRDGTGKWWYFNVHNVDNNRSGQYTSLVIDPATDRPFIAFHDQTRGAAMLAAGTFDGGDPGPCTVD